MTHPPAPRFPFAYGVWPALAGVALVAGCAGGSWLERPLAAELPIEVPEHSYPTAVEGPAPARRADSHDVAAAASSNLPAEPTTAEKPAIETPPQASEGRSRLERPQMLVPTLAVIPPELAPVARRQPAVEASAAVVPSTASGPAAAASPGLPMANVADGLAGGFEWPASRQVPGQPETIAGPISGQLEPSVKPAAATLALQGDDPPEKLDKARGELIQALETEIRRLRDAGASDEELPRLEQQLRLVYLTAGRLDDAVGGIESLDSQQQEAYKNLMFGLGVWLSPDEARRLPLRSAKVLHSLREATADLAAGSKLELKNLVFCERVDYFGWYTEFPKKEFQPKQQVILYVEVENFSAEEKGPAGFETELQGSYEILDASGQIIASRQLQLDKEICRNYRRDYFLAYRIYLPDTIEPGRYRLELTVEDLKARGKYQGRKLGEGMIEFSIR